MLEKETCYAVLALDDLPLSPEAKYFLIRLFYLYGGDVLVKATVNKLAKMVGLSEAVFVKTRSLLASIDYIEVIPISEISENKKKSGRPRLALKIRPEFVRLMEERMAKTPSKICQNNHPKLIDKLLFWSGGKDELRARNVQKEEKKDKCAPTAHTFTAATRILLAILYAHADPCGVVNNLSLSRLSKLTGMSNQRVESQLEIIKNLGYLNDTFSGGAVKNIFGRLASIFYMNITEDDYENLGSIKFILLETKIINHYNDYSWGTRLRNEARHKSGYIFRKSSLSNPNHLATLLSKHLKKSIEEPKTDWSQNLSDLLDAARKYLELHGLYDHHSKSIINNQIMLFNSFVDQLVFNWAHIFLSFNLHEFFEGGRRYISSDHLQSRIDHYTALLMSVGWNNLNVENLFIANDVLDQVTSDLSPSKIDNKENFARRSALALFFYCISYQQALMLKALIVKTDVLLLNDSEFNYSFAILPLKRPIGQSATRVAIAVRGGSDTQLKKFYGFRWIANDLENIQMEKFSESDDMVQGQKIFSDFGYDIATLQRRPE
jgi:hypothetical protein